MTLLLTTTAATAARSNLGPLGPPDGYGDTIAAEFAGNIKRWWRMSETSGTALVDDAGSGNGTWVGGPTFQQPPLPGDTDDTGIHFDGIDDRGDVPHAAGDLLATGSLWGWFRLDDLAADHVIIAKGATGTRLEIAWVFSTKQLRCQVGNINVKSASDAIQAGVAYAWGLCFGTGGMKLYLASGSTVAQVATNASTNNLSANTEAWMLGAHNTTGTPTLHIRGRMDEILLLDIQPSNAEIETITQCTFSASPVGSFEPLLLALQPSIYLKFSEASGNPQDSSGLGRHGVIMGTGATYQATALAANVGAGNTALNLGAGAWVEIPHAPADVALTVPTGAEWLALAQALPTPLVQADLATAMAAYRYVASVTVSLYGKLNSLPTGGNLAVLMAKSSSGAPEATYDGSFEAYADATGAVHLRMRSFRGRKVAVRTPNGAVSAGATFHLNVRLDYAGITATLNGAQFERGKRRDGSLAGIPNVRHVFGLAADILGVVRANISAWTIGKAAWGGQADLVVDEFAVFQRGLSLADMQALAQSGAVAPLLHHIFDQSFQTASSIGAIQSAIAARNAAGGGTVEITAGTYTGDITGASNVRLWPVGTGAVTINGRFLSPTTSRTNRTLSAAIAAGQRTLSITNTDIAAGDLIMILGTAGPASPVRFDRRWNTTSETKNPNNNDGEAHVVESRTGSTVTLEGAGALFAYTTAEIQEIETWTPPSFMGLEGNIKFQTATNGQTLVNIEQARDVRLVDILVEHNTVAASKTGQLLEFRENCVNCQAIGIDGFAPASPIPGGEFDGLRAIMGTNDIVFADCVAHDGSHAVDFGNNSLWGVATRCEAHRCHWDNAERDTGTPWGIHPHGFCLFWHVTSTFGGPAVSGWKNDTRWSVSGATDAVSDCMFMNDGSGDSYFREIYHYRPRHYFVNTTGSGTNQGCDRNIFRNIETSVAATGSTHGFSYGSGSNTNRYTNVDAASGAWTAE